MAWPSPEGVGALCLGVGSAQLAVIGLFAARGRRERPPPKTLPPVTVVVPCAGAVGGGEANLATLLEQDYPGAREYVFVVPSAADPAHARIARLLAGRPPGGPPARLLASELVPETAAGKPLDLAWACGRADPASAVLAFADADVRVGRGWLAALVGALEDPAVGVATAMSPFVGLDGPAGWLRFAWLCAGIPFLEPAGCPVGQTLAMRRTDMDALGVPGLWARSLSEDMSLSRRVRGWGKAVRFVRAATPEAVDGMEAQSLVGVYSRWTALFWVYRPEVWCAGALLTLGKLFLLLRAFLPAFTPGLLVLWLAVEAVVLAAGAAAFLTLVPEAARPRGALWKAALAAPFLPFLHLANFASSFFVRSVRWGPYVYRVRGPQDVVARPVAADPGFPSRAVGAAVLAGVLLGQAFRTGPWGALILVGFVPLFWALEEASADDAVRWGWLAGTVAWLWGVPWLAGAVATSLYLPPLDSAVVAALFSAGYGFLVAVWSAFAVRTAPFFARRLGPAAGLAAAFAAAVTVSEGFVPQIFPVWIGAALQFHAPSIQAAERVGVAGLGLFVVLVNGAVYAAFAAWRSGAPGRGAAWAAAALMLAGGNAAYGRARLAAVDAELAARAAAGESRRVVLVQSDLPPDFRRRLRRHAEILERMNALTLRALSQGPADLVVWPEGAFCRFLEAAGSGLRGLTLAGADGPPGSPALAAEIAFPAPLLFNSRAAAGGRSYNVSVLLPGGGRPPQVAAKRILVPVGEYMPLGGLFPVLYRMSPGTAELTPGRAEVVMATAAGLRVGPLVCYEALFPWMSAGYAAAGAGLLAHMADDSWGRSPLMHEQHAMFAALRAVETRRYLVRAVNRGVSTVVDPVGRIVARLPSGGEGFVAWTVIPLPGAASGGRNGRALQWAMLLVSLWALWDARRRPT